MPPKITVTTQAAVDNWRHLAAVARTYHRNPQLEAERFARTIQRVATGGDSIKGGTGAEVALLGAARLLQLEQEHGCRIREALTYLVDLDDEDVWDALDDLLNNRWSALERRVAAFARAGRPLMNLLGALAGITAVLDPDGALPILTVDGTEAAPWSPSAPRVAEWRRQLLARLETPETAETTAQELTSQQLMAILPPDRFPGLDQLARARMLCEQSRDQLRAARLYYADADTTALATRKASRPRKTPLAPERVPSSSGLLVFEQPIDHAPGRAPLVAASWSVWEPPVEVKGEPVTWSLSLFAHTAGSPPFAPIGFERLSAGEVLADRTEAQGDDAGFAARAVVACWDLITQERVGKGVVDVAEEKRRPVKVRSDRRRGILDDGTVRLVTIRGRQESVPSQRRENERTGVSGRRYDRGRWWVREHTRDHCMHPAAHRPRPGWKAGRGLSL
ncbi:hypothetical protein AB0D00_26560 [Streptomyces sp. NPDC048213]|uniref:hypothetical protein n=1 Tax=Streptomyces sp. NPDC048213 TaxID=3160984 RepID=UPI0033DF0BC3